MRRPARRREILGGLLLSGLTALGIAACADGDPTVAPPVGAPTSSASPSVTASPISTANSPSISTPTVPAPSTGGSTVAGGSAGSAFTVTRTGGLAGVMQSLAIGSDGSWFFTDRRDGSSQQGKFTTTQAQRLAALAADPALRTESRNTGQAGVCNDGYIYTISVGEAPIRYEQCGGGQSRPLTQELVTLLVDATPL